MGEVVTLATLTICGLATWRLASLLHTEDAFEWLRHWIGIRNDEKGYPILYPDTVLGKVFDCFWCLSLLTSALLTMLVVVPGRIPWTAAILLWLGASAFAIWLEKQVMRTQSR